ncbi:hypothetical protein [Actinomadura rugatobispora]|uniref:Uncharacterized protein n=1 Tax=Actinomadura rugatobispora TaxID=1994 RepID=A0ABW0ZQ44_9ACTN|nr:hypothetical protein GCM10010200_023960 [Actinomadura rugatobispora]
MTDDMLKDALGRIADRAEPVDGLAERALRAADRRRRTRATAGAALALAVAVAVPVTFTQATGSGEKAPALNTTRPDKTSQGLPENSPEELNTARRCLRNGVPRGMGGEHRPEYGSASDFRLLVKSPVDKGDYLAEVASEAGFVLCATSERAGNVEVPIFHAWPGRTSGGLWTFGAPFRVDAIRQVSPSAWDAYALSVVLVGRAKPGVARVRIAWENGRTSEATVDNGFFLGHTPTKVVPTKGEGDAMSRGAMSPVTIRVATVTGYDSAGRAVHTWRPESKGEAGGFAPADCHDGLTNPPPSLCSD